MSKAAAQELTEVIVTRTIECMVEGKKKTFLPSKKPQKLPESDAKEALDRGLAKPVTADEDDAPDESGRGDINV